MKIGLIGLGGYGNFLANIIKETEGLELYAVSSRSRQKLGAYINNYPELKIFLDWKELIKDPQIDLVIIATPPYLHYSMAKAAITASKHVLVEKPLALKMADANELIKLAEKKNVRLGVDHEMRYNSVMAQMQKVAHSGILGKLTNLNFTNLASDEGLDSEHWFWDKKKSGGIFVEHGCHFFDIYDFILGSSQILSSYSYLRNNKKEDKVLAVVKYDNGAIAQFWHSFDRPYVMEETKARFIFEKGQIEVSGWIPIGIQAKVVADDKVFEELKNIFSDAVFKASAGKKDYKGSGKEYSNQRVVEFTLDAGKKDDIYKKMVTDLILEFTKSIINRSYTSKIDAKKIIPGLELATQAERKAIVIK